MFRLVFVEQFSLLTATLQRRESTESDNIRGFGVEAFVFLNYFMHFTLVFALHTKLRTLIER